MIKIKSYAFILLCETWTTELSDIDLPHFTTLAMHRPSRHRAARRASGGVIVYIGNDIVSGVAFLKKGPSELVWIKLDKNAFGFHKDILMCVFYAILSNSSAQGVIEGDIFDQTVQDVSEYDEQYPDSSFIVCGDTNGRTGSLFDYATCDDSRYLPLSSEYVEDEISVYTRTNMDSVVNAQGQRMIDICKMCNLRIMNGRFGTDEGIGKYTCHTYNGSSTVDYYLCSPDLFQFVCGFDVKDMNMYSDHCPILFEMRLIHCDFQPSE